MAFIVMTYDLYSHGNWDPMRLKGNSAIQSGCVDRNIQYHSGTGSLLHLPHYCRAQGSCWGGRLARHSTTKHVGRPHRLDM